MFRLFSISRGFDNVSNISFMTKSGNTLASSTNSILITFSSLIIPGLGQFLLKKRQRGLGNISRSPDFGLSYRLVAGTSKYRKNHS